SVSLSLPEPPKASHVADADAAHSSLTDCCLPPYLPTYAGPALRSPPTTGAASSQTARGSISQLPVHRRGQHPLHGAFAQLGAEVQRAMAGDDSSERPSFASFWRKGKDKLRGKRAAPQGSDQSPTTGGESPERNQAKADKAKSDKEKALLRRQQVRRAQIQHRQRKANYLKQLELDVAQLRDLISLTEHEGRALKKENEDIRTTLRRAGVGSPASAQPPQPPPPSQSQTLAGIPEVDVGVLQQAEAPGPMQVDTLAPLQADSTAPPAPPEELFGDIDIDIDIDDWTVTLSMDETMGTPCFHISSGSSGASVASITSPARSVGDVQLTPAQEQRAINFILALEHVCWNHFGPGDFECHDHDPGQDAGHFLMASAYCMASAPETVYTDREALDSSKKRRSPAAPSPPLQWAALGVTLESLHGLARSLNPGDQEIAPVQAWFELASRYPVETLMGGRVLDTLQREFRGVVRCVAFGAAIERLAFESVIARVLGPSEGSLYSSWDSPHAASA
ncbi:Uncharacterized protein TPAR_03634, partial [Tolypocladium paradoxum]